MSISTLLRGGRLSGLFSSRVTAAGICTEEVFRLVLERERARADRNAHDFALVVFEGLLPNAQCR